MPDGGRLTIETDLVLLSSYYASTDQEVQPGNYVMLAVSDSGMRNGWGSAETDF